MHIQLIIFMSTENISFLKMKMMNLTVIYNDGYGASCI